jgi:hypothetical protein
MMPLPPSIQSILDIQLLGRRFPHYDEQGTIHWIISYDGKYYIEDNEKGIGLIDSQHYHRFEGNK